MPAGPNTWDDQNRDLNQTGRVTLNDPDAALSQAGQDPGANQNGMRIPGESTIPNSDST